MLKKGMAILLATLCMIGMSMTTFAALPTITTEYVNNDGETWKGGYWTDSFDYANDIDLETGGYPRVSKGATNQNVFENPGGTIGAAAIDADGGADGNGVLVITSTTTKGFTQAWKTTQFAGIKGAATNQMYVVAWDMKFKNASNLSGNFPLSTGASSRQILKVSGGQFVTDKNVKVNIVDNAWYRVVIAVAKTGTDSYKETRFAGVYDASGAQVVSTSATFDWSDSFSVNPTLSIPNTSTDTTTITMDNASITYYDMTQYAPSLAKTPSFANTEVDLGEQTFTIQFDQPISGTPTATVKNMTNTAAEDITCNVAASTIGLYAYTVVVPANTMSLSTDYQLSLTGFKNAAGTSCTDTVSFYTAADTAKNHAKTADFANPGSFSLGSGKFTNYPWLYFKGNPNGGTSNYNSGTVADTGFVTVEENRSTDLSNNPLMIRTNFDTDVEPIYALNPNKGYALSYRMRFNSAPSAGDLACEFNAGLIACDNDSNAANDTIYASGTVVRYSDTDEGKILIRNENINKTATINPDTWYRIFWTVNASEQTFYVYDDENHNLIYEITRPIPTEAAGTVYTSSQEWYMCMAQRGASNKVSVSVDDVSLWYFDKDEAWSKPRYKSQSVSATPLTKTDYVTLSFDQPMVSKASDYKVIEKSTGREAEGATVTVKQSDFFTQKISFTGLNYDTEYYLDYTGLTNIAGSELFAKNDSECNPKPEFMTASYTAEDGYIIAGSARVNGLTQGSTIKFDVYTPAAKNAALLVALYDVDSNLLGVEKYSLAAGAAGKTEATVTLNKDYSTATAIKIFAWNNLQELKPELSPIGRVIVID